MTYENDRDAAAEKAWPALNTRQEYVLGPKQVMPIVEQSFKLGADWAKDHLLAEFAAERERLMVVIEKQKKTIALMDCMLIEKGVNFDFSKVDEMHARLKSPAQSVSTEPGGEGEG